MAKIVLADDEEFVRLYLKSMLRQAGHEIVGEADNCAQLIEILSTVETNILILDINMPNLKGNDFLKEYGEKLKNVCVIILTISTAPVVKAELLDMGYEYILRKDTEPEELLHSISSFHKEFVMNKRQTQAN